MGISINSSFPRMRESMWLVSLDPRLCGDDEKGIFRGTLIPVRYFVMGIENYSLREDK